MSSDIDILLNHSDQMDSLTAAHLSEFNILLKDKEELRSALADARDEIAQKNEIIREQKELIQQLRQRNTELERRPIINTSTYIEKGIVEKMVVGMDRRKSKKKVFNDINLQQLQLWKMPELSM